VPTRGDARGARTNELLNDHAIKIAFPKGWAQSDGESSKRRKDLAARDPVLVAANRLYRIEHKDLPVQ